MFFELVDSARQSTDKNSAFLVKSVVGYGKFSASDKKKIKTELRTREKAYRQNKATDYKRTLLRFMRECGIHVVDSPAQIGAKMFEVLGK